MNALLSIVVVTVSLQGYWLEKQPGTIRIQWAAKIDHPDAIVEWKLSFADAVLSHGSGKMPAEKDGALEIKVTAPEVRVRTRMLWEYVIKDAASEKGLESGERAIHIYPDNQLGGIRARLVNKKVALLDKGEELAKLLSAEGDQGVTFTRLPDASALQTAKCEILIVGRDSLGENGMAQAPLVSLAENGCRIMVLEQAGLERIGNGISAISRPRPDNSVFVWRTQHQLFQGFSTADLNSLIFELLGKRKSIPGMIISTDVPIYELAYWAEENQLKTPDEIEALVAVKSVGKGKILFLQLPMADWLYDPRSQLLLRNALIYLSGPVEETLSAKQRKMKESRE